MAKKKFNELEHTITLTERERGLLNQLSEWFENSAGNGKAGLKEYFWTNENIARIVRTHVFVDYGDFPIEIKES